MKITALLILLLAAVSLKTKRKGIMMNKCALLVLSLLFSCFATTYYVRIDSANYDHTVAGTISGTPLKSPMGIQKYLDTATAGDTCRIYGATLGRTDYIQKLSFDALTGTFARADTINNLTRSGVAICYRISATNDSMIYWLKSGSFLDNDSIRNNADNAGANVNGTPVKIGLVISKTAGTINAPFTILGCNSSWVEDTAIQDTLSGNNSGPVLTVAGSNMHHYTLGNLAFIKSSTSNLNVTGSGLYWIIYNCSFNQATANGITTMQNTLLDRCRINSNGAAGLSAPSYCLLRNCEVIGNTTIGVSNGAYVIIYESVIARNGTNGINTSTGLWLLNSVIDTNAIGVNVANCNIGAIIKCKITNNTGAPITIAASHKIYEAQNIMLSNGNSNTISNSGRLVSTGESVYTGTQGYINRPANNYSPNNMATGKRVKTKIGSR